MGHSTFVDTVVAIFLVVAIAGLIVMGIEGFRNNDASQAPAVEERVLVLTPAQSGVRIEGCVCNVSFDSDSADIEMHEGWRIPAKIYVTDAQTSWRATVMTDARFLPPHLGIDEQVEVYMSEEIRIPISAGGLILVNFGR